jgi:hypothetical protein
MLRAKLACCAGHSSRARMMGGMTKKTGVTSTGLSIQ